ncbi:Uncharacterised protein [Mycobacteroides abscessus subsp. massiliense]|nr:Uncharacterised protein [Mycobacteroides abscessus subsp. massiliense]
MPATITEAVGNGVTSRSLAASCNASRVCPRISAILASAAVRKLPIGTALFSSSPMRMATASICGRDQSHPWLPSAAALNTNSMRPMSG